MVIKMTSNLILVEVSTKVEGEGGDIALPSEILQEKRLEKQSTATTGIASVVGPDCESVEQGDFVFYKQFVGNILDHESLDNDEHKAYIVVSEKDILGFIPS